MRKTAIALGLGAALAAAAAWAAPGGGPYGCGVNAPAATGCVGAGPGYGAGGMGPGMGYGRGPGYGGGGMGMGYGGGPGGEALLTSEERAAHRDRMHAVKTVAECKAAMDEHRALLEARAKERGVALPAPRVDACERMALRGRIE